MDTVSIGERTAMRAFSREQRGVFPRVHETVICSDRRLTCPPIACALPWPRTDPRTCPSNGSAPAISRDPTQKPEIETDSPQKNSPLHGWQTIVTKRRLRPGGPVRGGRVGHVAMEVHVLANQTQVSLR